MTSKPMNLIYIFSDEHNREMNGCYGHPVVKTPNIDKLAENGVRFNNAYCNSPICVPSRASLATGRYVHETSNWDNAMPYVGEYESWGHCLEEQGYDVITIGKLHYRDDNDPTGFPDMRYPMQVDKGQGDTYSLIRDNLEQRHINRDKILEAGPGESSYIRYDRGIAEEAVRFLTEEAHKKDKPWVLFLGFVSPHFPLIAPQKYFDMYPLDDVIFPRQYNLDERPKHPLLEEYRHIWDLADELDEKTVRKAVAAYYGLCTFLDNQIGKVINAMESNNLEKNTRVIYTSDHGDTVGDHGLWFKSSMYEGSVGVPFIMSGPDLPKGQVSDEPISLIDSFPTIVEAVGAKLSKVGPNLPGTSLLPIAKGEISLDRAVFSEYHAMGFRSATYMLRNRNYKLIYYVNFESQLFDLEKDPKELNDLARNPEYKKVLAECEQELRKIIDPEKVHEKALKEQSALIESLGGKEKLLENGFQVPFSPVPKIFQ